MSRVTRIGIAVLLVVSLVGGITWLAWHPGAGSRTTVTAYFTNTNGIFVGDDIRILGVRVGRVETIEPQPDRVKVTFWFNRKYRVPADAAAVIVSPSLVTARAIQLTPAYTAGPTLADRAVIPQDRTAVPVEWDDFRRQLEELTKYLQPTEPGGVSTLGSAINTATDNLRGQGSSIRDTVIKLSQAFSALGDHSGDLFGTVRNLSVLVSALQSSAGLIKDLNTNLAAVTRLLANDPDEIGRALTDLDKAVQDVAEFTSENRDALATTSEKLASVTSAVRDSLDDIKQTLHVAPTAFQNFLNIYEPAHASLTGILALNNFSNTVGFICGAVQAASRLGQAEAAKLCVQYLAPIVKNRVYNFPPLGLNLVVNAQARPNEVTYSEEWMRPDYVPPAATAPAPPGAAALPAEQQASPPMPTDPGAGLPGLMMPGAGG